MALCLHTIIICLRLYVIWNFGKNSMRVVIMEGKGIPLWKLGYAMEYLQY